MASNLAKAGLMVQVWNRTPGREGTKRAVDSGAKLKESIAGAVAGANIIFLCLSDVADLEDVLFRSDGVCAAATKGSVIIDMSTTGPACAQKISAKLKALGLHFVDAPVSGGDIGARNASLTIMCGGDKVDFDYCLPVFEKIGRNIHYCGPSGSGQAIKLCNQILCAVNMVAVCEAIALSEKMQIDPKLMIEVCGSGAAGSWALSNLGPRIVSGNLEPGFMIKDMQKDLRLVSEALGDNSGKSFEGTELASKKFVEAAKSLDPKGELKGTQAMIAAYRS